MCFYEEEDIFLLHRLGAFFLPPIRFILFFAFFFCIFSYFISSQNIVPISITLCFILNACYASSFLLYLISWTLFYPCPVLISTFLSISTFQHGRGLPLFLHQYEITSLLSFDLKLIFLLVYIKVFLQLRNIFHLNGV